jgi:hypothetical protein
LLQPPQLGKLAGCYDGGTVLGGKCSGGRGHGIDGVSRETARPTAEMFQSGLRPILGLRSENGKLRGVVKVWFRNSSGSTLELDYRNKVLSQLNEVNQRRAGRSIDLTFVLGSARKDSKQSEGSNILIEVSNNLEEKCGSDKSLGCYINSENEKSRRLVLSPNASTHTVTHEFFHYLGLNHNSTPNTLMYHSAPQEGRGSKDRQLQKQELINVVDAYNNH